MRMPGSPRVWVTAAAGLACNVTSAPPSHPVAPLSFSGKAKADVVDLIVGDRTRADRLRQIYLRIADLEVELDRVRARVVEAGLAASEGQSGAPEPGERVDAGELERFLLPPLDESRTIFDRYVALVIEARGLLTEHEFQRLGAVR